MDFSMEAGAGYPPRCRCHYSAGCCAKRMEVERSFVLLKPPYVSSGEQLSDWTSMPSLVRAMLIKGTVPLRLALICKVARVGTGSTLARDSVISARQWFLLRRGRVGILLLFPPSGDCRELGQGAFYQSAKCDYTATLPINHPFCSDAASVMQALSKCPFKCKGCVKVSQTLLGAIVPEFRWYQGSVPYCLGLFSKHLTTASTYYLLLLFHKTITVPPSLASVCLYSILGTKQVAPPTTALSQYLINGVSFNLSVYLSCFQFFINTDSALIPSLFSDHT